MTSILRGCAPRACRSCISSTGCGSDETEPHTVDTIPSKAAITLRWSSVMVQLVTLTLPVATIDTEDRLRSLPDVPTLPSITAVVPSDFHNRKWVAVPVLSAEESAVTVPTVSTPPDALAANGVAHVSSASKVPVMLAATFAGRVPE